jgi:hypothetical protein
MFRYFYVITVTVTTSFQLQAMSRLESVLAARADAQPKGTLSTAKVSMVPTNGCAKDKESKPCATQQAPNKAVSIHAVASGLSRRDVRAIERIIAAYKVVDGGVSDFIEDNARVMLNGTPEKTKKTSTCCSEAVIEESGVPQDVTPCVTPVLESKESKDCVKKLPDLDKLSIKELNELVVTGNADAMNELGQRYEVGNGVVKNENMAVTYYIVAACELRPASPKAMCNLARYTIDGKGGLRIAVAPALDLLQYASQLGVVDAMVMLAFCLCNRLGKYNLSEESVDQAMNEAMDWAERAASLKGVQYVENLTKQLRLAHFGFNLRKCAYCDVDFTNIDGTKRNDMVELPNDGAAHRHCYDANHAE